MRKIRFIFLVIFIVLLTGCSNEKYDPFNFDDAIKVDFYTDETNTFRYVKEKRFYSEKSDYCDVVRLFGLTKKGSELEYLFFPNQIDGMDVIGFGCNTEYVYGSYKKKFVSQFRSTNLKRLYFDKDFKCDSNFFKDSYNLVSLPNCYVVWISVDGPTGNFPDTMGNIITWDMYKNNCYSSDLMNNKLLIGNVTFQYNYEDAPNSNVFFIDSFDNTNMKYYVTNPSNVPIREGFHASTWKYINEKNEEDYFWPVADSCPAEMCVNKKKYDTYSGYFIYMFWVDLSDYL